MKNLTYLLMAACLVQPFMTMAEVLQNPSAGRVKSLCTEKEKVIFSCSISSDLRVLSICGMPNASQPANVQSIQYRFGRNGEVPELTYPQKSIATEAAFSFLTRYNSTGIAMETISFSRGNVSYDVMTPEKSEYVSWTPFTGVAVTIPNSPPELIECWKETVAVDISPIKKLLNMPDDGHFSDALPKVKVVSPAFPTSRKVTTTSTGMEVTISYPTINDSSISTDISKFIGSCESSDYDNGKGSQCERGISTEIVDGKYLVIHYNSYNYAAGTPHGYPSTQTKVYWKNRKSWQLIKPNNFFKPTDTCRKSIGSMVYRQLAPLELTEVNNHSYDPDWIVKEADIYPTAKGFEFTYQPYQLGSYAGSPWPLLLPWKKIRSCLTSVD